MYLVYGLSAPVSFEVHVAGLDLSVADVGATLINDSDMEPEPGSPSETGGSKRKMQPPAFDVEALQHLLRQQTEGLQASQQQSIDGLESRSIKRLEGLERSILERFKLVDDRLLQQDAKIDNLAKENASLVDRVGVLEKRESSTALPSRSEPEKNLNTVVLGGWPRDTKREVSRGQDCCGPPRARWQTGAGLLVFGGAKLRGASHLHPPSWGRRPMTSHPEWCAW